MAIAENADQSVPDMAVDALQQAFRQASASGEELVFAVGDRLVKRTRSGRLIELKKLTGRIKVDRRVKRSES